MAENWFADVQRYVADADEKVVGKIVSYLGIALRNRDSSMVSFSDPQELGRVKERFLRKKLALTAPDDALDQGLDWVKGVMSGDRTKNRVTVYYLLAHYFGKLDLFGGRVGTTPASLGGAAPGSVAASHLGPGGTGTAPAEPPPPVSAQESVRVTTEPVSTEHFAGTGTRAPRAATAGRSDVRSNQSAKPAYAADAGNNDEGGSGWPRWLTWLLIALAVVALLFLLKSCWTDREVAPTNAAPSESTVPTDSNFAGASGASGASSATAVAVPSGAGVVSSIRDNKPMLSVYFASGQSAVSNDFANAAGSLKGYLDANPGTKLAVSGFNDPSGNAALNAELSKKRAQAVAAALTGAGIPEGAVELVKPADTTSVSATPDQARRVEVTVL